MVNRRSFISLVAGAAAVPRLAWAQAETKPAEVGISPLMRTLSEYIVQAGGKALPDAVTEATKHHLLDTLAAMVSGSHLLPGRKAIDYVKANGGTPEASVPGSRVMTTVVNAALAGGMLAHSDETDEPQALVRGLGETYEVVNTNIKRWTVGSPIQAPLDSLFELMKTHKFKAADVDTVVARLMRNNRIQRASLTGRLSVLDNSDSAISQLQS